MAEEYQILRPDKILGKRKAPSGEDEYLIKWQQPNIKDTFYLDSWEPYHHLTKCEKLINAFDSK